MVKVEVDKATKTVQINTNGKIVVIPYLAIDIRRSWYISKSSLSGTFSIHHFPTGNLICDITGSGMVTNLGYVKLDELGAIQDLYWDVPEKER